MKRYFSGVPGALFWSRHPHPLPQLQHHKPLQPRHLLLEVTVAATVAQLQGPGADNGQQTTREPPWQRQHLQHSYHQPTPSQPRILLI